MRNTRVLALLVVVAMMFTAVPSFAKVCHPKKPITCQATHFSSFAASSPVAATPIKAKSLSLKAKTPAKVQQAMLCGPWVKWMCTGQPLS